MRLIDADEFKRQIAAVAIKDNISKSVHKANVIFDLIDLQPTAYNVEKVVQEIEEEIQEYERLEKGSNFESYHQEVIKYEAKIEAFKELIEIVRNGGKE